MNDVTTFLVVTAAIFAAIIVLLVLMSHLESELADQDAEDHAPR
jgi:preprotein translocase subunit SecG